MFKFQVFVLSSTSIKYPTLIIKIIIVCIFCRPVCWASILQPSRLCLRDCEGSVVVRGHQLSRVIHSVKWAFSRVFQDLNFDLGLTPDQLRNSPPRPSLGILEPSIKATPHSHTPMKLSTVRVTPLICVQNSASKVKQNFNHWKVNV